LFYAGKLRSKRRGQSPRKLVKTIRSKNFSIYAAISKSCLIFYNTIDRPLNGRSFSEFLVDVKSEMESQKLEVLL
jgi:hypothetical protein